MASDESPLLKVAAALAPRMLDLDQGHERVSVWDEVSVEVAWYRENEWRWMLAVAIDTESGRVETPPQTSFSVVVGEPEAVYVGELTGLLECLLRSMFAA